MAKMVKAADLDTLSHDNTTLVDRAISFVMPHVQYDQEILDTAYEVYGDNASLAVALSGTSDKKSKAYKAALRSVQIWKKTDSGPGRPAKGRTDYKSRLITAVANKDGISPDSLVDAAGRVSGVVTVSITGYIQISNTPAEYRTLHAQFDGSSLQDFLEAAVNGDTDTALALFSEAGSYPAFQLYGSSVDPIIIKFS